MNRDIPVNERIAQLLERCSNIKRGSDLHVEFDAKGEAAARAIAERDRGAASGLSPKAHRTGTT